MKWVDIATLYDEVERAGLWTNNSDEELPTIGDADPFGDLEGQAHELVCSDCVNDKDLKRLVFPLVAQAPCHFCGTVARPQNTVWSLFDYLYRSVLREYGDPADSHLSWDGETDSYFGVPTFDTYDLLGDLDSPLGDGSELQQLFCRSVEHDWYRLESDSGLPHERMIWGWQSFTKRVRNGPRFLVSYEQADIGESSAEDILFELSRCAAQLGPQFVKTLYPGAQVFRARKSATPLVLPSELGPPPLLAARAQRMSAEGESCFYGAEDAETAVSEVLRGGTGSASVGRWQTTIPFIYVDLATSFLLPGLFNSTAAKDRSSIRFLEEFSQQISQPTDPTRIPAIEYLPTQIVTEYFRYKLSSHLGQGVAAIRYRSVFTGKANWVLFPSPRTTEATDSALAIELLDSSFVVSQQQ